MRRHAPDLTSLIAGLTFCGIAVAYIGGQVTHRSLELRWVMPILLIGLGLAGLAGTLARAHRHDRGERGERGANGDGTDEGAEPR